MNNKKVGLINPLCFSRGRSQKRGVGNIISMLVAIVAVVIILFIFALGSYFVKWTEGEKSGINLMTECAVGIEGVFVYMSNFDALSEARHSIVRGGGFESVLKKYENKRRGDYRNLKEELENILNKKIEFQGREQSVRDAIVSEFRSYDRLSDKGLPGGSFLRYVIMEGPGRGYIYDAGHTSETRFLHADVDKLLDESLDLAKKIKEVLDIFSNKYVFEMPFALITESGIKRDSMGSYGPKTGFTEVVESDFDYGGETYRIAYRRGSVC